MEQLNEYAMRNELEEAWKCRYPDKIWYLGQVRCREDLPLSEIVTEEARQRFIDQGLFPEEVTWDTHAETRTIVDASKLSMDDVKSIPKEELDRWYREDPILRAGVEARARG